MHRVTLSSWHDGQAPGTELDVDDDELAALRRDGRVAEARPYDDGGVLEPGLTEAVNDTETAQPVTAPTDTDGQAAEEDVPAAGDDEQPKGRRRR
ncbi:hypothetical protein PYK79_31800 [Streptomyces sp. ID05-04B]|uniref:hypothetical protein n=1 Tax=Streptomyces sp. ID05-04B TaxID=3028661 RepID=UPI0029C4B8BF|nr:hypothetical protein [Streptomyces sp. ID05-04B]MDX5566918.1 hypothetical protein [Streptomyces sp. ID05-04B]